MGHAPPLGTDYYTEYLLKQRIRGTAKTGATCKAKSATRTPARSDSAGAKHCNTIGSGRMNAVLRSNKHKEATKLHSVDCKCMQGPILLVHTMKIQTQVAIYGNPLKQYNQRSCKIAACSSPNPARPHYARAWKTVLQSQNCNWQRASKADATEKPQNHSVLITKACNIKFRSLSHI